MRKTIMCMALAMLLFTCSQANAKIVYLSQTGSDDNDGATALTAYASLTKAVDGLAAGDVVMVDGMIPVSVEAKIENIGDAGVKFLGTDAETCGFDAQYQSRFFNILSSNVYFSNLTFTRGCQEGSPGGGAIYQKEGELTLEDCILGNNKTNLKNAANGGALRLQNVALTINNSEFFYNRAFRGGAIEAQSGSIAIDHSVFVYNYTCTGTVKENGGAGGGAISFQNVVTTKISNCTFDHNTAHGNGGAFIADGANMKEFTVLSSAMTNSTSGGHGGLMMINLNSNPELKVTFGGTTIAKNLCKSCSGAIFVESTGVEGQEVNIVNCTITSNETKSNVGNNGGIGMFGKKATLNVVNTILEGNWSIDNNRYTDGWWKNTPVNVVNSFVGYIYECNGEGNKNYEEGYNMQNSHFFTTPTGASVMLSGISTEADCDGYCYPLYPGSEATTMGDVELAKTYGVAYDQKGNEITKPYIGAVQYVLGEVIPAQLVSPAFTADIEQVSASQNVVATRYELYNLSGQKLGVYSHEPNLNDQKGTFILVEVGKTSTRARKIINN